MATPDYDFSEYFRIRREACDLAQQDLEGHITDIESQVVERDGELLRAAGYAAVTGLGIHFFGEIHTFADHLGINNGEYTRLGMITAFVLVGKQSFKSFGRAMEAQIGLYLTRRKANDICGLIEDLTLPLSTEHA